MTVYTLRPRVHMPWWALVFVLPFYMLYAAVVLVVAGVVLTVRASVWALGAIALLFSKTAAKHVVR